MTFLELCQGVGTDSGLISFQNKPATVVNPTGKWAEIVSFTRQAYDDIQRSRTDWQWLRGEFTASLVIGQASYTPAQLGIASRFRAFEVDVRAPGVLFSPHRLYDPAIGEADSQDLVQISPECWSVIYGRGEQTPQRPTEYALANGKFYVGAKPDKTYTILGRYRKAPQSLALDADLPELPEHFHEMIKWKGIMKISGKDGAFTDRAVAQAEYSSTFRQLCADQTEPVSLGPPLA